MASAATLRERQAPEARVYAYIKDPLFGSTARKFVQLIGFRNVQSTISMTTSGTASVTFPNFKGALMRYISLDKIQKTEKPGQGEETTNTWSWQFFMDTLTQPDPNNPFYSLWNDVVLSRGEYTLSEFSGGPLSDSAFINRSRSRGDVLDTRSNQTITTVNDKSLIYCLPFMNLFDPIFIDYKGQDGKWYAGFTGLVTRIGEQYSRTADQSITLTCRDLTALLDNVSLVTGWNMMNVAETHSNLREFVYSSEGNLAARQKSAFADIFGSFNSVEEIILQVVKRSQDMWRFEAGGKKVPGEVGIRAFKFDVSQVYDYTGISNLRGSIQMVDEHLELMKPEYFYEATNDSMDSEFFISNNLPTATITGDKKIFIDPLIRKFDNVFIHKLLNRDFSLFKDSLKSADQILNEIAAKMFAYKYFDGNGNLVFELAKPNALPNLEKYGGRGTSTFLVHAVSSKAASSKAKNESQTVNKYYTVSTGQSVQKVADINKISRQTLIKLNGGTTNTNVFGTSKGVLFLKDGAEVIVGTETVDQNSATYDIENNSIQPIGAVGTDGEFLTVNVTAAATAKVRYQLPDYHKYTTVQFHGKNYMLSPDDFISFAWAIDEAALTTVVATESNFSFIEGVDNNLRMASTSMHGVAVADFDMLAKLGVRRFQTQSLYNVKWPDANAGARVLSYMSACILERVNCMADSGSFAMNQRPELQLGRTFINPLRMKSYLITGLTNSWSAGSPHTTNITCTYGHPLHKTLEVPWLAIFMEPEVFFKDGDAANIFDKLTGINAAGFEESSSNSAEQNFLPA